MAQRHHKELDYNFVERIIDSIDNAPLRALKRELLNCVQQANNVATPKSQQKIWKNLAELLRAAMKS